jgi:acyl-CoA thioesterase-1
VAQRWRWLGTLLPGTRARRRQIVEFAEAWRAANESEAAGGRLWVVLGDSSAQAIGASRVDRGYVGLVQAWLAERDGAPWRVVNLSKSGALAADVVADQLPVLATLQPDLVSCAVGANDLLRRSSEFMGSVERIAAALPAGALLANLPRGLREQQAQSWNVGVAGVAERHDLRLVDLWSATGPPWRGKYATDWFHPNDVGYRDWARAFSEALGDR